MIKKLSAVERRRHLAALQGWKKVRGREAIFKSFRFRNFNEAFGFMTRRSSNQGAHPPPLAHTPQSRQWSVGAPLSI